MKMRLTIKAIIRWEQLTGRPFSSLDYSDSRDVEMLFYTVMLCSGEKVCTLEAFRTVIKNEKLFKGFVRDLEKDGRVVAQFQRKCQESDSTDDGKPGFVKDVVHTLILEGVNPDYVLNDMWICDLPELIMAYERKKKEQMEASRLWTFFSILPHVDGSKVKVPSDMYPFPWEMEEEIQKAEKSIEEDQNIFESFMKEGKNLFN
ncbi:hypothetical protein [Parabacteroides pacaensis]|uniref:hypothetical protein n=1 Tax=Parabacteroides pacaensis TaxID=2086575 RepID=UPI000D11035D|nr:hypothetical protein [Parabacteroides pacaensis]